MGMREIVWGLPDGALLRLWRSVKYNCLYAIELQEFFRAFARALKGLFSASMLSLAPCSVESSMYSTTHKTCLICKYSIVLLLDSDLRGNSTGDGCLWEDCEGVVDSVNGLPAQSVGAEGVSPAWFGWWGIIRGLGREFLMDFFVRLFGMAYNSSSKLCFGVSRGKSAGLGRSAGEFFGNFWREFSIFGFRMEYHLGVGRREAPDVNENGIENSEKN